MLTQPPGCRNDIFLQRHQRAAAVVATTTSAASATLLTSGRLTELLISWHNLQEVDIRHNLLGTAQAIVICQRHVITDKITRLHHQIFHKNHLVAGNISSFLYGQKINCPFVRANHAVMQLKLAEAVVISCFDLQNHFFKRHDILVTAWAVQRQNGRLICNGADIKHVSVFTLQLIEVGCDDAIAGVT